MKIGITSGDWQTPLTPGGDHRWGGSGWARIGQYLKYLPEDTVVGTLAWNNKDHFVVIDHLTKEECEVDTVVMQRLMHKGINEHIPQAQAYGQKFISDIDDWYWGVSPSNKAFSHNHPKNNPNENTNHYRGTIAKSDVVLCSTPYLQNQLRSLVKGEMVLLENTIDLSRFTQHVDSGEASPTVGWVGSTAHRSGDIETLRGVLDVMAKRGEVKLYHGGNHMSYPTFASLLNVPDELVTTAPLHPIETYATLMSMDIGIIPLRDFPFNRCKSDIKGMEYAASGIPFIAQNLDAYVQLNESLGVGRLAKKPADWIKHLKQLIADPALRREEGARNRDLISARDILFGAQRFVDVVTSL